MKQDAVYIYRTIPRTDFVICWMRPQTLHKARRQHLIRVPPRNGNSCAEIQHFCIIRQKRGKPFFMLDLKVDCYLFQEKIHAQESGSPFFKSGRWIIRHLVFFQNPTGGTLVDFYGAKWALFFHTLEQTKARRSMSHHLQKFDLPRCMSPEKE